MLLLEKNVKLIIMNRDNDGKDLSNLNKKIVDLLTKSFGGTTVSSTYGTWSDNKQTYEDPNKTVQCNYHQLTIQNMKDLFQAVQLEFNEGRQEAVSLLVNDKLAIIEKSDTQQDVFNFINIFK
jgi:hypothetical protein